MITERIEKMFSQAQIYAEYKNDTQECDCINDDELEALVTELEAKWASERKAEAA